MPVVGDKYFFQNMPKTGTHWVQEVLVKHAGGEVVLPDHAFACYAKTADTSMLCDRHIELMRPEKPVITVIRHPLDWLRSFWEFRMRDGWANWGIDKVARRAIDAGVENHTKDAIGLTLISFPDLVEAVLEYSPGMVSKTYRLYTRHANYVCRLPHLAEDTVKAFEYIGQKCCADGILNAKVAFKSQDIKPVWAKRYKDACLELLKDTELPPETVEEFEEVEKEAYEIWNRAGVANACDVLG